jgi:hypothetical protein
MANRIQIRRGSKSTLPSSDPVRAGELKYTIDTKEIFIDDGTNNVRLNDKTIEASDAEITAFVATPANADSNAVYVKTSDNTIWRKSTDGTKFDQIGRVNWGEVQGTLSDQSDLYDALVTKADKIFDLPAIIWPTDQTFTIEVSAGRVLSFDQSKTPIFNLTGAPPFPISFSGIQQGDQVDDYFGFWITNAYDPDDWCLGRFTVFRDDQGNPANIINTLPVYSKINGWFEDIMVVKDKLHGPIVSGGAANSFDWVGAVSVLPEPEQNLSDTRERLLAVISDLDESKASRRVVAAQKYQNVSVNVSHYDDFTDVEDGVVQELWLSTNAAPTPTPPDKQIYRRPYNEDGTPLLYKQALDRSIAIVYLTEGNKVVGVGRKVNLYQLNSTDAIMEVLPSLYSAYNVVDDVKVNGSSVVTDKIASIDISGKLDKVSTVSKVYGTNASGDQTTYDVDSFGQVDDVKVNGSSVVTDKIASIDISGKLDKIDTADELAAYTHDGSTQGVLPIASEATASTLVVRDSSGRIKAAAPEADADVVIKSHGDSIYEYKVTGSSTIEVDKTTPTAPVLGVKTVAPSTTADEGLVADAKQTANLIAEVAKTTHNRGKVISAYTPVNVWQVGDSSSVSDPGQNYVVGDSLQYGLKYIDFLIVVTDVDNNGAISNFTISSKGGNDTDFSGTLNLIGGSGGGASITVAAEQTPGTTLANVTNPAPNDEVTVVLDELHSNNIWTWMYADYNGDGIYNWVSLAPQENNRDFVLDPIETGELTDKAVTEGKQADYDTGTLTNDSAKFADNTTFTATNFKKSIAQKINALRDDKVDKISTNNQVYGTDTSGTQSSYTVQQDAHDKGSIVQRTDGGAIEAGDPTQDKHAATKGWTNTAISGKQDSIPASTGGYLATHSGTAGSFGTPVDSSAWQKSQVPAGTTTTVLKGSGTAGTFGAFSSLTASDVGLENVTNAAQATKGTATGTPSISTLVTGVLSGTTLTLTINGSHTHTQV